MNEIISSADRKNSEDICESSENNIGVRINDQTGEEHTEIVVYNDMDKIGYGHIKEGKAHICVESFTPHLLQMVKETTGLDFSKAESAGDELVSICFEKLET